MNPLTPLLYPIQKIISHYEKIFCGFLMSFILSYYVFEMMTIRPKLVEVYQIGPVRQFLHVFFSTYCFVNVAGNMVLSVVTDSTLKKSEEHGVYCAICKMLRSAGSWHCSRCNACIVRRDHHCIFLSTCIGFNNQRYFILFLFHVTISMMYSTYYNYYYVSSEFDELGVIMSAFRILNPLFRFMIQAPMGLRDLFTLCLLLNGALLIWSSLLFMYHILNVVRGVTAYENKMCYSNLSNWRENLVRVFGERWLLAVAFPFVHSSLPKDVRRQ